MEKEKEKTDLNFLWKSIWVKKTRSECENYFKNVSTVFFNQSHVSHIAFLLLLLWFGVTDSKIQVVHMIVRFSVIFNILLLMPLDTYSLVFPFFFSLLNPHIYSVRIELCVWSYCSNYIKLFHIWCWCVLLRE